MTAFDYRYAWKRGPHGQENPVRAAWFGRLCRPLAWAPRWNSVLIERDDGERMVTSRYAIRKVQPA